MANEEKNEAVRKWSKGFFSMWPPPVPTIEERMKSGNETRAKATFHFVTDLFNATAARAQKFTGSDAISMRYAAQDAVLPVAEAVAQHDDEIAELRRQIAELQKLNKPSEMKPPGG
jgi:hypothetical protein